MKVDRGSRLRVSIATEAARLMYEEGVKQYFTAKRLAAKRVCGRVGGKRLRYRPGDLPSNGEIRDALNALAELAEGSRRSRRLFAMRVVALEAMKALSPFDPRLIGSVSTGHIRRGSDIDLHVFTDDPDPLIDHVRRLGWVHELERVTILKFGKIREYLHVHVADVFAVELTVYERRELRFRPRSSTDGKPIDRINIQRLEAMMRAEHADAWHQYLADGSVEAMDEALAHEDDDAPAPGPFDGLLADPPELPPWPADEPLPEDEEYDALPGFESFSPSTSSPPAARSGVLTPSPSPEIPERGAGKDNVLGDGNGALDNDALGNGALGNGALGNGALDNDDAHQNEDDAYDEDDDVYQDDDAHEDDDDDDDDDDAYDEDDDDEDDGAYEDDEDDDAYDEDDDDDDGAFDDDEDDDAFDDDEEDDDAFEDDEDDECTSV